MERFKNWSPTCCDSKGAFLDERQDWFVLPVIQTRDSNCLERSNFKVALEMLGGESETVEVHRFGHWGPGWFEIIVIDPSRETEGENIEKALSNYPLLDEDGYCEMQYDQAQEDWMSYGAKDVLSNMVLSDDDFDNLPENWESILWDCVMELNWAYEEDGGGFRYNTPDKDDFLKALQEASKKS